MHSTSAVDVSIHATSPLFGVGAGAGAGLASSFFSSLAGAASFFSSALAAGAGGSAAGLSWADRGPAFQPRMRNSASAAARFLKNSLLSISLKRLGAGFAGANADDLLQLEDEDLAVADLAGVG